MSSDVHKKHEGLCSDLCRLCAECDTQCVGLFGTYGSQQKIIKKIEACLPVSISKDDRKPKQICRSCLIKLDTSYQLYTTCLSAQEKIEHMLSASKADNGTANKQKGGGIFGKTYSSQNYVKRSRETQSNQPSKVQRLETTVPTSAASKNGYQSSGKITNQSQSDVAASKRDSPVSRGSVPAVQQVGKTGVLRVKTPSELSGQALVTERSVHSAKTDRTGRVIQTTGVSSLSSVPSPTAPVSAGTPLSSVRTLTPVSCGKNTLLPAVSFPVVIVSSALSQPLTQIGPVMTLKVNNSVQNTASSGVSQLVLNAERSKMPHVVHSPHKSNKSEHSSSQRLAGSAPNILLVNSSSKLGAQNSFPPVRLYEGAVQRVNKISTNSVSSPVVSGLHSNNTENVGSVKKSNTLGVKSASTPVTSGKKNTSSVFQPEAGTVVRKGIVATPKSIASPAKNSLVISSVYSLAGSQGNVQGNSVKNQQNKTASTAKAPNSREPPPAVPINSLNPQRLSKLSTAKAKEIVLVPSKESPQQPDKTQNTLRDSRVAKGPAKEPEFIDLESLSEKSTTTAENRYGNCQWEFFDESATEPVSSSNTATTAAATTTTTTAAAATTTTTAAAAATTTTAAAGTTNPVLCKPIDIKQEKYGVAKHWVPTCSKRFPILSTMTTDVVNNNRSMIEETRDHELCPHCKKLFPRHIINHHKVLHNHEPMYSCIDCGKNYLSQEDLNSHQCVPNGDVST